MANEIQNKIDAVSTLTITLASLASGSARQSTAIVNTNQRQGALVNCKIMTGTTPTNGSVIEVYGIRLNANDEGDDGAGLVDAAITIANAPLLGTIVVDATSNKSYSKTFDFGFLGKLGPKWGIAIKNNTGAALHATGTNHVVEAQAYLPEIQ